MRTNSSAGLRLCGGVVLAALAVTAAGTFAPAAPLDPQTCEQLKGDIADLERIGARANMAKGAAWGKANLNSAQLEQVKKLIEIDEAIAFRCVQPKPQPVASAAGQGKVKAKVLPKAPARAKAVEVGASDQNLQTKAKPKAKPASASAVSADPAAAPIKPRPRPPAAKPQDAHVPAAKAPPPQ